MSEFQPFIRKPCKHCPFKKDCLKGWLGRDRAEEIAHSIGFLGQAFTCHNTNESTDEGIKVTVGSKHCAGAAILLDREDKHNQSMQIAQRLGLVTMDWFMGRDEVFDTLKDFINHHDG